MLVLSRKENQQILFPGLGIEVEVCRISGKSVSVGVKAPKCVQILRGELAEAAKSSAANSRNAERDERQHALRNQLNKAQLTVAIAQRQLQMGREEDAEQALREMLSRLTEIEQSISQPACHPRPHDQSRGPHEHSATAPTALVVEDDANERALMAGYLNLCGFQISEAVDGVEAMEFLEHNEVDLVVLDMRMPRMDGKETVKAIRRRQSLRKTKVVVVSGDDREDAMVTGDDRGVSEWFSKPLDARRFASYLGATLH